MRARHPVQGALASSSSLARVSYATNGYPNQNAINQVSFTNLSLGVDRWWVAGHSRGMITYRGEKFSC